MQLEWQEEEENQSSQETTLFAEIILPFSLPNTYTYRIPRLWLDAVEIGKRVVVPFGKKKYYSGIIQNISHQPPKGYEAKYIHSVLDDVPLVNEIHLQFWKWMASYYLCNLGDVMTAALPSGLKMASETKILPDPNAASMLEDVNEAERLIMQTLIQREVLTITEMQEIPGIKNVFASIKSLYHKGLLFTSEEMNERYIPKVKTFVKLNPLSHDEQAIKSLLDDLERKAPKQADALLQYLVFTPTKSWVDKLDFQKKSSISAPAVNALINKEIFITEERRVDRLDIQSGEEIHYALNEIQTGAKNEVIQLWNEEKIVLLHGITGSGKSFIYFDLIKEALERNEQVLYLLPEIALTVQLMSKLKGIFKERVYVSHSRFNEHERVEIYRKVASGESCVVIGARSAVFLPFRKLGLLVIDEEHDSSFKQQDPAPRYHGRDAAIYLGILFKSKIILGSATPSLESFYNTQIGKYGLVEIEQRFGESILPAIELVDLGQMKRKGLMRHSFSKPLLQKLEETIKQGKQAILFQNRKGYVPIILCNQCGWTLKCMSCDITMTYYKSSDMMRCNYCGYSKKPLNSCPTCGSEHLEMSGFGTEMIEEELKLINPDYRVTRFDQSSAKGKHAHYRIIHEFEDHEIDVLVGTQMLAKGLDFEGVSLVGVIHADQLLNFPNFRAFERAFQLLTQVAGRAGRRAEQGKVLIQTYKPEHPILRNVVDHHYKEFYTHEIADREKFNYPPFSKLIEVTFKSLDYNLLNEASLHLSQIFKKELGSRVLGPEVPYVSKIRDFHLRRILIKLERDKISHAKVKNMLRKELELFHMEKRWRQVRVIFDVDPD